VDLDETVTLVLFFQRSGEFYLPYANPAFPGNTPASENGRTCPLDTGDLGTAPQASTTTSSLWKLWTGSILFQSAFALRRDNGLGGYETAKYVGFAAVAYSGDIHVER
jgi:hypothetical protein